MNAFLAGLRRAQRLLILLTTATMLAACGSSGGGSTGAGATAAACDPADLTTTGECGELLVAVTDADGDFVSYVVDVLSVSLQRPN